MRDREAQHVLLAAVAVALAVVCETFEYLRDDERDVVHVDAEVVAVDAGPEG